MAQIKPFVSSIVIHSQLFAIPPNFQADTPTETNKLSHLMHNMFIGTVEIDTFERKSLFRVAHKDKSVKHR